MQQGAGDPGLSLHDRVVPYEEFPKRVELAGHSPGTRDDPAPWSADAK